MPPRKILIDCDPGTDDTKAILMALSHPDVEVVAITTVVGNCHIHHNTRNALRVLKLCDRLDVSCFSQSIGLIILNCTAAVSRHNNIRCQRECLHVPPIKDVMMMMIRVNFIVRYQYLRGVSAVL